MMNVIAARAGQDLRKMAAALAAFPAPDRWTPDQRAQAVNFAALLDTAQKVIAAANIAGIDYEAEKTAFLDNAGKSGASHSKHTETGYRAALARLEAWAAGRGFNVLELKPAGADDFIYSLLKDGRSPASVRLDTAAASSFFTFLERRHETIKNPFRGTKARPVKKPVKETAIPSAGELRTILSALGPADKAAASVMAFRGLRAGALPTLSIVCGHYRGASKGKSIDGKLPAAALDAIKAAGLSMRSPFAGIKANTLEHRIARAIEKLFTAGKVKAAYSCHDLRHFYALADYRKHKDIYRLKELLNHASIQVTETYLRGLRAMGYLNGV